MKRITLAAFVALFISACAPSNELETTTICGEVINVDSSSPKVLTVFPYDFADCGGDRFAIDISESEYKFNQKITMTHRHDAAINYNGEFYSFIAEPCDSIFVTIDAVDKSIIYSGSNARFNSQMQTVSDVISETSMAICRFDLDADVEGVVTQIKSKMEVVKDTLDSYCVANSIDDDVKSYTLNDALFVFANYILMYDRKNEYSPERYKLLTHEIFDIYNPDNSLSNMYSVHIMNSFGDFMNSDPELREEFQKQDKDIMKVTQLMLDSALKLPKSMTRDIVISNGASYINRLADYLSVGVESFYDERFIDPNNYSNPKFMELYVRPILQPVEQQKGSLITGDLGLESDVKYINSDNEVERLNDIEIIDYVKERYKGRVIYIDVWATWCGPCIEEMRYAKKLHKMYEEREDIVFVNLCLSSKADNWVESIEKSEIDGENYFIESDDVAKMLLSTYKLDGYPSFILIDKGGDLVTNQAFRPSSLGSLSKQLESLL